MSQREVELILTRQLASYLSVPVFLCDADGTLVYYNEAAEPLLGSRFTETGTMALESWTEAFAAQEEAGGSMEDEDLPVLVAIHERRPVHRRFAITGLDDERRVIEVAAFPLIGARGRVIGGVGMFWEAKNK